MPISLSKIPIASRRAYLAICASLAATIVVPAAEDGTYEQGVLRSRKQAQEHFESADGPLTLVARFSPREGTSTLGKDPSSSLVLVDPIAPSKIGEVTVKGGRAILRFAPGVEAQVDGKQASVIETDSKSPQGVGATIGSLRVMLYFIRDEQLQISISDPTWILRRQAQQRSWFGVDKKYRVSADWIAYPSPQKGLRSR